ncbi:transmembrane protein, putative [Bodo saltans]|uniref:Transmembrane protein, putative n=1 Tax=Bodo saltans TaxID=75058 RepID=A0A0S4KJL0_BODSA|nr:transmembrane protein, putative [Bodo saltans]|eukprot:CUI15178.1 transmembrane protein, putative [Bodo saltans]
MNYSCNFECGFMHSLRSECSQSCPNVVSSCTAARPDVYNRSTAFFSACQEWCCSETNNLAIAMIAVVGAALVLLLIFGAIVLKKCYRKRSRESMMAKAVWRPAARDAFAFDPEDEMSHQHNDADHDMNPTTQQYLQSKQGATLGEESGAAFQHRAGNENPYLVGGVVSRRGSLPPDPNGGGGGAPGDNENRRSFMYDGEISLGFADEDFYIVEADRADGVSFAGSRMSRRSSTRSGAIALPMAHVRDPTASASTSQQISPRSDAGDAAMMPHASHQVQFHTGQTFHTHHTTAPPPAVVLQQQQQNGQFTLDGQDKNYWSTADHRGRPLSASKQQTAPHITPLPLPGGVSPRPPLAGPTSRTGSQAPPPQPYVGLGGAPSVAAGGGAPAVHFTPGQRPLSGSVRRQSAAAVTWDIFEDVDVAELERVRSSSRLAPLSQQHQQQPSAAPPAPGSINLNGLFGSAPPPLPPPPPAQGTSVEAVPLSAPPVAPPQQQPPRRTSAGSLRRVSATVVPSSDYLWDAEIDAEIFDV